MSSEAAQLLTAEQLADRWQVKSGFVYELTRRGEIPAVRLGRYYRYRLDQIEAFELDGNPGATGDLEPSGPVGYGARTR